MGLRRVHEVVRALAGPKPELLSFCARLGFPDAWHSRDGFSTAAHMFQASPHAHATFRHLCSASGPAASVVKLHELGGSLMQGPARGCSSTAGVDLSDIHLYLPTRPEHIQAADAKWAKLAKRQQALASRERVALSDAILAALSNAPLTRLVPLSALRLLLTIMKTEAEKHTNLPAALNAMLKRLEALEANDGAFRQLLRKLAERVCKVAHQFSPYEAVTALRSLTKGHPAARDSVLVLLDRLVATQACLSLPMADVVWTAHLCVEAKLTSHPLWQDCMKALRQRAAEVPAASLATAIKCAREAPCSYTDVLAALHHAASMRHEAETDVQWRVDAAWQAPRTQQAVCQDLVHSAMRATLHVPADQVTLIQLSAVIFSAAMQRCLTPEFAGRVRQRVIDATPRELSQLLPRDKVRLLWGLSEGAGVSAQDAAAQRLLACLQLHEARHQVTAKYARLTLEACARLQYRDTAFVSRLFKCATGPFASLPSGTDGLSRPDTSRADEVASGVSKELCVSTDARTSRILKSTQAASILRSATQLGYSLSADVTRSLVLHTLRCISFEDPNSVHHVTQLLRAAAGYPALTSDVWAALLLALQHVCTRHPGRWNAPELTQSLEALAAGCMAMSGHVVASQHLAVHAFLGVLTQRFDVLSARDLASVSQWVLRLQPPAPRLAYERLLYKVMQHTALKQMPPGQLAQLMIAWLRHTRAPASIAPTLKGQLSRMHPDAAVLVAWSCAHMLDPSESLAALKAVVGFCRGLVSTMLERSRAHVHMPLPDVPVDAPSLRLMGSEEDEPASMRALASWGVGQNVMALPSSDAVAQLVCVGLRCAGRVPGAEELVQELRTLTRSAPKLLDGATPPVRVLVVKVLQVATAVA